LVQSKSLSISMKTKSTQADCFVIAPFKEPYNDYYKTIIKPTLRKLKISVARADEIYSVKPIIDDVIDGIYNSKFIVAELSERNANVNYELGIAHSLGKPVVLLAKSINDIPFDYRHLRVIIYDATMSNGRAKLKKDIEGTISSLIIEGAPVYPSIALQRAMTAFSRSDVEKVFLTRQEMNVYLNSNLCDLKHSLDICAFGLKSFRDAKTHEIRSRIHDGLKIRILCPQYDSVFVRQREADEHQVAGSIANSIRELVIWANELNLFAGTEDSVTVKMYDGLPLEFYLRQEDIMCTGPYLYGRGSQQSITYALKKNSSAYDYFVNYFDDLWKDPHFAHAAN
jgi:hypothetical protein